ncbi:hypothetical protein MIZ03_4777 [Rhodoferax lithotrophicus]|uniref:Uncharacterized protein n=1 Tax=Rhodoferax lithotrophicus TaxID=2798804 RepID=A0ABM7MTV2_9BURK|nr:hypothetical protein MIZ03_4777 [Rhodoferax sp. MIZ03]
MPVFGQASFIISEANQQQFAGISSCQKLILSVRDYSDPAH